jgi:hypothetical protein
MSGYVYVKGLHCGMPMCRSYSFPKVAKNNGCSEADATKFMDASHKASDGDASGFRNEFAVAARPSIFEKNARGPVVPVTA